MYNDCFQMTSFKIVNEHNYNPTFKDTHKGNYLMDQLCHRLEIKEKDYFGLRYVDNTKQRQWLDLGKLIIKQCKDIHPLIFSFRVKFYPAEPFHLSLNVRVLLYKQLKRDLNHGRIYCSSNEIVTLGALIVQEQFADYDENIHTGDYISHIRLSARQTDAIEKKIIKKHKERKPGQDPNSLIDEFLGISRNLETYGIEPHYVKDHQGVQMYIGINFSGISGFISGKRTQHFRWNEIRKLNFEGKMFIAHIGYMDTSREVKKYTIGFKCTSGAACRYLWRCAVEHMLFFTLPNCQNACVNYGGGIFSRGAKFKYSGRTEREILNGIIYSSYFPVEAKSLENKNKSNSVPVTPSSPKGDFSYYRYNSLPRSGLSVADSDICNQNQYFMDFKDFLGIQSQCVNQQQSDVHDAANTHIFDSNDANKPHSNYARASLCQNKSNNIKYDLYSSLSKSSMNKNMDVGNTTHLYKKFNNTKNNKKPRIFHVCRSFFPSVVLVIIIMTLTAFIVFEFNTELFDCIRNAPEMRILIDNYYIPLKQLIKGSVIN
ncbi:FERM domain-containing protein 5 isoform X2 [Zeugodacus cucurbitae]|uniref:FERM domain-containing protein 5 isoform X2 n=1 Tax=Zeugodacus cucurbitae TaxID=28588 RepID=UPI0023D958AF|nr:FERM domain-containing protein 5 isoform X2 [Zeugodacus cucurbitae]